MKAKDKESMRRSYVSPEVAECVEIYEGILCASDKKLNLSNESFESEIHEIW